MRRIHWVNTTFLFGTLLTTVFAVPVYIWHFGLDAFQIGLFLVFFVATGMSITLGYHRLFSHLTFQATLPVRVFTLLFGAAAFEASALTWCADHRRHHKFTSHDDDPYNIREGFWHAHIGWLLFRQSPETPLTWVRDLQKDPLVRWQHRFYIPLAIVVGFFLPTAIGFLHGGWTAALGAFLIAGVARVVLVHHVTFCINSLCHWTGSQPYSSQSTARDSFLMALFTFGEGYHNFHHEFQHDYRNGVKPWQFDPTKWTIRLLGWLGLVRNLRTVSKAKILKAEIAEQQRRIAATLGDIPDPRASFLSDRIGAVRESLDEAFSRWESFHEEYRQLRSRSLSVSRSHRVRLRRKLKEASARLSRSLREWRALGGMVDSATGG